MRDASVTPVKDMLSWMSGIEICGDERGESLMRLRLGGANS